MLNEKTPRPGGAKKNSNETSTDSKPIVKRYPPIMTAKVKQVKGSVQVLRQVFRR